jgi:hypothetical protein
MMAGSNDRRLQDFLGAASNVTPNETSEAEDPGSTSESDDMDYEPPTHEESDQIHEHAFIQSILEAHAGNMDEEEGGGEGEGHT